MDKRETIICHSFPAWDSPYIKSTIELMKRLSHEYRVVFIDYHYTLKDIFFNKYTPKNQVLGMTSRWRYEMNETGNIEIFNFLPLLPINWIKSPKIFRLAAKINGALLRWQIKKIIQKNQLKNAYLVNAFNPIYGVLTHCAWEAKKSIYYCYDEISGTDWSGKHGPEYENILMRMVDQVIVSSPHLKKTKMAYNENTELVPNGVDLNIFGQPNKAKRTAKSIGYIGAVDQRIDIDLINHVADAMPDYQFDFYGPVKADAKLFLHKNIVLHGALPQHELPEKIASMQACLIPFVKTDLTAAIYPLKANEYLAMGKPVISTDFADLEHFNEVVSINDSKASFTTSLHKALKNNTTEIANQRIAFAQSNSWVKRSKLFGKHIMA